MLLWWGPDLLLLYNDAWRPVLGAKHPSLARPGREVWSEIWHIIGPMLEGVLQTGHATWQDDGLLMLERSGYLEEAYFTYSYSPVWLENGAVGGAFAAVSETTARVLGARRLRTLRDLGAQSSLAKSAEDACVISMRTLAENPADVPFALLYLLDERGETLHLKGWTAVEPGHVASPRLVQTATSGPDTVWPFADVLKDGMVREVNEVPPSVGSLPSGPWPVPPHPALVLPLQAPGQERLAGVLICGANPCRRLEGDHRTFFDLMAGHIATTIGNARAYEQERSRAEALVELDRAKTAFFSNVSHEFRTPLTLMLGPLEDILNEATEASPDRLREQLSPVYRNSLRLLKLVNTLLDFSRIEAGRMVARYEPTDIAALTADLASVFRSAVERAHLRLTVDCPPLSAPVYVDHEMWEKIVLNLLSNAFKYTFEGQIVVALQERDGHAELRVRDTGIGIPADELPKIFTRFHRVQGAQGRTHEGSGIGLALVQELVKCHGGSITVESVPNHGTTFTVRIPLGREHLPAERIGVDRALASTAVSATAYVQEALRWLPGGPQADALDVLTEGLAHPDATGPVPETHGARVLLAEDNADLRDYIGRLLRSRYEVQAVADGKQALVAARRNPPDLVLTDIMMPRLDGFGLLRALRADEATRQIPVVMLSARAGEESRVEGMEAGADDYLVKPFSARELLARVGAHLQLARLRREAADRERALRTEAEEAHARVSTILESITDGFIALDAGWRFIYVNATAERINGLGRDEMLGKTFWEVFPTTRGTRLEVEFRRALSKQIPVTFENFYEPWKRWFAVTAYPAKDGGLSIYFQDITDAKQAQETQSASERRIRRLLEEADRRNEELRTKQEQLIQTAKLASLGELTTGVAHELNNPLNNIGLFIGNMMERLQRQPIPGMERYGKDLPRVLQQIHKASAIVDHLRTFGRGATAVKAPLSVNSVISAALSLMAEQLRLRDVTVTLELASDDPHIRGNAIQLEQVFINLLNNAKDAIGAAATKRITIRTVVQARTVLMTVHDTGVGMDPDVQARIFDPFYTTKPVGQGTGLGLSITYGIIQDHLGTVAVESVPGKGATFTITFPLAEP
ncbi:MAG: response regulator [Nitrospirales bacterium]|nr:response regulator [Nitrospirales bacterium]